MSESNQMDTSERRASILASGETPGTKPDVYSAERETLKWKVFAWGAASHGQLGIMQLESDIVNVPTLATHLNPQSIRQIACGLHHSIFLLNDGTVLSCGSNEYDQLGRDRGTQKAEQIQWLEAQVIRTVACGAYHTLCVNTNGQVFSFGKNDKMQLGREGSDSSKLIKLLTSHNVIQATCGSHHSVVLTDDGQLYTFGSNREGQLGIGETIIECFAVPQKVSALAGVPIRQVAAGGSHTLVLTTSGAVFAWGSNSKGQIGSPTEQTNAFYPVQCRPLRSQRIVHIACGEEHSMALTAEGGLFTFGGGACGQLGHLVASNESLPRKVFELMGSTLSMMLAGRQHSIAQLSTGRVFAFGSGGSGQLGIATPCNSASVTQSTVDSSSPNRLAPACLRNFEDYRIVRIFSGPLADHCFAIGIAKKDLQGCEVSCQQQELATHFGCSVDLVDLRVHSPSSLLDESLSQLLRIDTRDMALLKAIISDETPLEVVQNRIEKLLSSFACINSSFLRTTNRPVFDPENNVAIASTKSELPIMVTSTTTADWLSHFHCSSENHGIDLDAAVDCFRRLALNSRLEPLVRRALLRLVSSTSLDNQNYPDVEALRWCLILPLSAVFEQAPELFGKFQLPVCLMINNLGKAPKRVLTNWLSSLQPRHFSRTVRVLRVLVVHLLQTSDPSSVRSLALIAFLDTLQLLNHVNQQRRIVPFENFYISELSSKVDIRQDYLNWCQERHTARPGRSPRFCDYPFVFDAQAKSMILHTDACLQMRNAVQYSQANALLGAFNPAMNDSPFAALLSASPFMTLCVTRQNLLANALYQLQRMSDDDVKKPLKVVFSGEDAIDESGVAKEFFLLICRDLISPKFGMFQYFPESRLLWFNADAFDEEANMFGLVGTVCGLAIYNAIIVDLHFPLALYKRLLGLPLAELCTLDDMMELDPTVGRSLHQILQYDGDTESFQDTFALTFEVTREVYGEIKRFELKPGGAQIPVTKENRQEYVDAYVKYMLIDSCERHLNAFNRGFQRVCGGMALQLFQPAELRAMVIGNEADDFDWSRLEKSAQYKSGFHVNHPVIRMFWEVFHSLSVIQKKKFLQFLTGSDRIPMLELENWFIVIQPVKVSDEHLPVAHTCFNLLDLPLYSNKEILRTKLLQAIENTEGFGLA